MQASCLCGAVKNQRNTPTCCVNICKFMECNVNKKSLEQQQTPLLQKQEQQGENNL